MNLDWRDVTRQPVESGMRGITGTFVEKTFFVRQPLWNAMEFLKNYLWAQLRQEVGR